MSDIDSDASDYEETEEFCKTEKFKKHMYKKLKDKHGVIYAELIGPYAEEKYGKGWKEAFMRNLGDLSIFSKKFKKDTELFGEYYPLEKDLFKSFELVKLEDVKCIIWGQDPYPQKIELSSKEKEEDDEEDENELRDLPRAQGYSFGVHEKDKIPGSLKNIFKGMKNDYENFVEPQNGDISYLCKEGVLFMNMCLAYFPKLPFLAYNLDKNKSKVKKNSEKKDEKINEVILLKKYEESEDEENEVEEEVIKVEFDKEKHTRKYMEEYMKSWLPFSYLVIDILNSKSKSHIHMLWGGKAKLLKKMIKSKYILESSHPSNLANTGKASDPFKDNKHFLTCNLILLKEKKEQINWNNPKLTKKKTDAKKYMKSE